MFQIFCHFFRGKGKQLAEIGFIAGDMQVDGIIVEEIDRAGEVEGGIPDLYFADGQAQEPGRLIIGELDIGLEVFVAKQGGIVGTGVVGHQVAFQVGSDLSVLVPEGGLDTVDICHYVLSADLVEPGDAHVLQDEFLYVQVERFCRGGGFNGGVGGDARGFDDIELPGGVLYEVEMAIFQQDHFYVVLLFQDIRQAEADIHAFGLVDGFISGSLPGQEFYVLQPDGDIRKILEYREFAAADDQFAGQLFVDLRHGHTHEAFLLGKEDGDGDNDQYEKGKNGDQDETEKSFACFRRHRKLSCRSGYKLNDHLQDKVSRGGEGFVNI